jgi:hypothetical protein
MTDVYNELASWGLYVPQSGPLGVQWGAFRVYSGGGIAGNSDIWWIDVPGEPNFGVLGPCRTPRQLRRVFWHDWFVPMVKFGLVLHRVEDR